MDPKQLRQIIKEEVTGIVKTELEPINKRLDRVEKGLDSIKTEVRELSENVDAARGDIESLHMDVKAVKEKQGMYHSRNKREIDEVKTHLGLPLMPDIP